MARAKAPEARARAEVAAERARGIATEQGEKGGVYLNDGGRTRLIEAWEAHKETELRHQFLGRQVERWALPSVQATLLARHLRGDLPAYPPFVLH